MILSSNNFTQNQFIEDETNNVKSPLLSSFNNMFYYEFDKIYQIAGSTWYLSADKQLNAKGNPTKEPCNNYIKYYISATGTFTWYGSKYKKEVTGNVVTENQIFTTPKYNYTSDDINKWLDWINTQIVLNNGAKLTGSSNMVVDETTQRGNVIFYVPHDKDFMSKYFTAFPSKNVLMPFNIENGIIDGMFQPTQGEIINKYLRLYNYLSSFQSGSGQNYVSDTNVPLIYKGFDDDDVRNETALNNLDSLDLKPYSCYYWDTNAFTKVEVDGNINKDKFYKPLLGSPIYSLSWYKIKTCHSGIVGDKRGLVESDCWAVTIVKMEAGFLTK